MNSACLPPLRTRSLGGAAFSFCRPRLFQSHVVRSPMLDTAIFIAEIVTGFCFLGVAVGAALLWMFARLDSQFEDEHSSY